MTAKETGLFFAVCILLSVYRGLSLGMNRKNAICFWLVLSVMLISLYGCAGSGTDTENEYESTQAQTDSLMSEENFEYDDNYIVIGISQIGSESDWRTVNTQSYINTFTREKGYYLIFDDGQQKQENQIKAIRKFILQEVDYIILDPIIETGWDTVLKEAKDANIPVIIADRQVETEDDSLYKCWIGSNFKYEGWAAGEWLEKYLKEQKLAADVINIVMLEGTMGSSAQIGRTKGFRDIASKHRKWIILDKQSGDFTQAKAKEVMEEFLDTYDNIDVVISENDNMTFGAIEAIKESGRTLGKDGDIIIISFDAVRDALIAIQKKEIAADIECNPLLGPKIEEIILDMEAGKKIEKFYYIDETYFDYTMNLEGILQYRSY